MSLKTVKESGATGGDTLYGAAADMNGGLRVRINASQTIGSGGRLVGSFEVLDAGNGIYSAGIRSVTSKQREWSDASDFITEVSSKKGCAKCTHILNLNALSTNPPEMDQAATYLLTWNPNKWNWKTLPNDIDTVARKGFIRTTWSCGLNKNIQKGDRLFIHRQGVEPRGIFGSGYAISDCFTEEHWDENRAAEGKEANYIEVEFTQLFDPFESIIPRYDLSGLGNMHWDTQMSGTWIPPDVAQNLEVEWQKLVEMESKPDDLEPEAVEGILTETKHYVRGRSSVLRKQALAKANGFCAVCDVDYKKVLKGKGARVLQVHHLKQMASTDKPRVTKLSDLAVVCANCHTLIHSNPLFALPIETLKDALRSS
jgi:hypothetical protein